MYSNGYDWMMMVFYTAMSAGNIPILQTRNRECLLEKSLAEEILCHLQNMLLV
jgi:hypothetical protein